MSEGTLALTERDRERLWVLKAKQAGRLRTKEASERLGVTRRHVRRLVRDLRRRGDRAIVHGLRGRQGNRVTARRVRAKVLQLQAKLYADYGPTLLAERLSERHGIELSPETLRLWLIAEGRWKRRRPGQRLGCGERRKDTRGRMEKRSVQGKTTIYHRRMRCAHE